jgi:hypothetical protein
MQFRGTAQGSQGQEQIAKVIETGSFNRFVGHNFLSGRNLRMLSRFLEQHRLPEAGNNRH